MQPLSNHNYRPDIDGLRAIAVLSVIIFHINPTWLPGGFVGVDIFFVISGYLISLHIFRDIDSGRFSLREFYRRRIKRIIPVMFVVLGITTLVAQIFLLPRDAEEVARSALFSLLSLANVYFWIFQDLSYFADGNSTKPLLHLWSLGVEEQFYIIWPLILTLVYRLFRSRTLFILFALTAFVSFLFGEFFFAAHQEFVYYMLPARSGELLLGALAAHIVHRSSSSIVSAKLNRYASFAGILCVLSSLIFINENQVFPGIRALIPTVGTALIILTGASRAGAVYLILKIRVMVFVGAISYSAYLWHWPLLAFYLYFHPVINLYAGLAIFGLTILLAWLSYRWIESPTRVSTLTFGQILMRYYVTPGILLTALAVYGFKSDGYGLRMFTPHYKERLTALQNKNQDNRDYKYVCQKVIVMPADLVDENCVQGAETPDSVKILLWGDSNASHYIGLLSVFAREGGFKYRNIEIGSCPPLLGDPEGFTRKFINCRTSLKTIRPLIDSFDKLIVSANWLYYNAKSSEFMPSFFADMQTLVGQGKLIIFLGKAPEFPEYDRKCILKSIAYPPINCEVGLVPLNPLIIDVNQKLQQFAKNTEHVEYFDANDYLCSSDGCNINAENGESYFFNQTHLSIPGSKQLGEKILETEGLPFPFTLLKKVP